MSNRPRAYTNIVTTLVVACAIAAFPAQPATAQTAKKLNCKGCVKSKQLQNNGIKSTDIKNGQVKNADLGSNAVTSDKIADGAVGAADLGNNAVTTSEVADDSLFAVDLADEPGADFDGTAATAVFLTSAATIYETVTLTAPTAGLVIVNASGWYNFQAGAQIARCSITRGTFIDGGALAIAENDDVISWLPWALTRAYEVPAGSFKINLVCHLFQGSSTRLGATNLNALFVPTRY